MRIDECVGINQDRNKGEIYTIVPIFRELWYIHNEYILTLGIIKNNQTENGQYKFI